MSPEDCLATVALDLSREGRHIEIPTHTHQATINPTVCWVSIIWLKATATYNAVCLIFCTNLLFGTFCIENNNVENALRHASNPSQNIVKLLINKWWKSTAYYNMEGNKLQIETHQNAQNLATSQSTCTEKSLVLCTVKAFSFQGRQ